MPLALLDALLADERAVAERVAGYSFDDELLQRLELVQIRRDQLVRDPARYPWSLRAILRRDDGVMVGFVNFHGPPGVNDTMTPGAAELGWTVFPPHQRRGYATETARALMDWAATEHGVRHFISSTTPENAASLRVHEKLSFARTGEVVDGEIIFELRR